MDAAYPQVKCGDGLRCHRDSKWYYECVPEVDATGAWKLEAALHTHASTEQVLEVEGAKPAEVASEQGGDSSLADEFAEDDSQAKTVVGHFVKEGADFIKSMFQKQTEVTAEEANTEAFHHEYNLAKTLAGWAHRRQIKTDDVNSRLKKALDIDGKIDQFGQCGGRINAPKGQDKDTVWDGAQCWPGWSCVRVNQWYFQCQPIPSYNRPETVVSVDGANKKILDVWAQCGGKGGQVPDDETPVDGPYPKYICFANTECTRQNEWYWQCLPQPGFNFGGSGGGGGGSGGSPSPQSSPSPVSPSPSPEPPVYGSPAIPTGYSPYASPPLYSGGRLEDGYYSPPVTP